MTENIKLPPKSKNYVKSCNTLLCLFGTFNLNQRSKSQQNHHQIEFPQNSSQCTSLRSGPPTHATSSLCCSAGITSFANGNPCKTPHNSHHCVSFHQDMSGSPRTDQESQTPRGLQRTALRTTFDTHSPPTGLSFL